MILGASVYDIISTTNSVGQLMKNRAATNIGRCNGSARAKMAGGNFVEEDAAEVDLTNKNDLFKEYPT